MICPSKTCKQEIDDDSIFCDQCGSEIFICPKCQTLGVGKFCAKDGQKLESRKKIVPSQSQDKVQNPVQPEVQAESDNRTSRIEMNNNSSADELIFVNSSGLELRIKDKDILGRTEGQHFQKLEGFKYLSRKHAEISNKSGNWFIKDLDSSNKTKVNNVVLEPNIECIIKKGDKITLADQEFDIK